MRAYIDAVEHAHALLGEQPEKQALGLQGRIEQLVVFHGGGQHARAVPIFLVGGALRVVLGLVDGGAVHRGQIRRFGRRLNVARQLLHDQTARAPAPAQCCTRACTHLMARHDEAHERRDLLGLPEVRVSRLRQRVVGERDNALGARLVAARIDRHREMAAADQMRRAGLAIAHQGRDTIGIEAGEAAEMANAALLRTRVVHRHLPQRTIRLCLQDEAAVGVLQQRAEQRGQR